jgi:hypothetical protein
MRRSVSEVDLVALGGDPEAELGVDAARRQQRGELISVLAIGAHQQPLVA